MNKEIVTDYDAVLISINHSMIDYAKLAEWSERIIDMRDAMAGIETKNQAHMVKA